MNLLTQDAVVNCAQELGIVGIIATKSLVTVARRPGLVATDPEQRPIACCTMYGPTVKPCTNTLKVQAGYSDLLRINGKRVCLDTVTGLTDGTPPGTVKYSVRSPGQSLVREL